MKNCIFCKIIKEKVVCNKVYEDKDFLAFLDIRPLTKGNTLVIPKKHYRWPDDVPNFGDYFEAAKKVGLAAKKAFGAEWISYITIGLEVLHSHIRVVPRYSKDLHGHLPDLSKFENYSEQEMKKIADDLRRTLRK